MNGVILPDCTYSAIAQPIYSAKCGPCHTGSGVGGHDIGISYEDATQMANHPDCAGKDVGHCTLTRIWSGDMPAGMGCGGPVDDDAANADTCITYTEISILEEWLVTGQMAE